LAQRLLYPGQTTDPHWGGVVTQPAIQVMDGNHSSHANGGVPNRTTVSTWLTETSVKWTFFLTNH